MMKSTTAIEMHESATLKAGHGSAYRTQDQLLAPLIKSVERERNKEDEFHLCDLLSIRAPQNLIRCSVRCPQRIWCHLSRNTALRTAHATARTTETDHRAAFSRAVTTLSHRSHRSGCAVLMPTVDRWRQQRAHFAYG